MSRIGKNPVELTDGVTASVQDNVVEIKGPKGTLKKSFDKAVVITLEGNQISVKPVDESRFARAMWGTARSIIQGMVEGVKQHYKKTLHIVGVGCNAKMAGKALDMKLGHSHNVVHEIPEGLFVSLPDSTTIVLESADKQLVGQHAGEIAAYRPHEPYKGKGVRIDGKFARRKEGKKTA